MVSGPAPRRNVAPTSRRGRALAGTLSVRDRSPSMSATRTVGSTWLVAHTVATDRAGAEAAVFPSVRSRRVTRTGVPSTSIRSPRASTVVGGRKIGDRFEVGPEETIASTRALRSGTEENVRVTRQTWQRATPETAPAARRRSTRRMR